ncbi:hypothetical protein [Streptomyces hiroshimensis]|uniref:Uncharacterized protein n=1 Tax=Streptomyces hiroshimensis TaxID=66424 RepID=A0ABQ2YZB9_9ACTN|nr:hypothetical protein [Streptomyces hiroshimensis]GGX98359.1 hypothetical protein GCM10010324_50940 [Streptomyces hiroshimensis]
MDTRSSPLARLRSTGALLLASLALAGAAVATTTTTTVTVTATTTTTGTGTGTGTGSSAEGADPCRPVRAGACPHRN